MHYLNQIIYIFVLLISSMNSFAGLGGEDDTWNADTADVNSCLIGRKGIDLDNAYYQKIDIAGELPFIRKYKTDLSSNPYEIGRFYEDKHRSIGGWQHNYTNYLYLDEDQYAGESQVTLKLPSEDSENIYYYDYDTKKTKKMVNFTLGGDLNKDRYLRFPPVISEGLSSTGYIRKFHTSDKDIVMVLTNKEVSTISVTSKGSVYKYSKINLPNISSGKISKLYKVTEIKHPEGTVLKLKYDMYGMLVNVDDNRGNHLKIYRDNRNFI